MCAPQPEVFTTTCLDLRGLERLDGALGEREARACSPACACSAPQQACARGATTSPPLRASTRAVARLCAPKTTCWTQPVSRPTRPRRAPSAARQPRAAAPGRAAGGSVGQQRLPAPERPGRSAQQTRARGPALQAARLVEAAGPPRPAAAGAGSAAAATKFTQRKSRRSGPPGRWRSISARAASMSWPYGHARGTHGLAGAAAETEDRGARRWSRSGRCGPRRAT